MNTPPIHTRKFNVSFVELISFLSMPQASTAAFPRTAHSDTLPNL
jgi:hypothetical protein